MSEVLATPRYFRERTPTAWTSMSSFVVVAVVMERRKYRFRPRMSTWYAAHAAAVKSILEYSKSESKVAKFVTTVSSDSSKEIVGETAFVFTSAANEINIVAAAAPRVSRFAVWVAEFVISPVISTEAVEFCKDIILIAPI
tara:strand:- start:411 stop:833 length:423 start_codon:yes stop_codon:yes gene_type:complete